MRTILRILIILLMGALISGVLYLTIENTSIASSVDGAPSFDQIPAMPTEELSQLLTRPDGNDHDAVSLSRGLLEAGVSLAKLTGITLLALLVQKVFEQVKKRRVVKLRWDKRSVTSLLYIWLQTGKEMIHIR